jgi:hypothetical protein
MPDRNPTSTINLVAESTLEPIRSLLLSIFLKNPLWDKSEVAYYPSFHLAAKYTLEPIRSLLLSIFLKNPLWDQSEVFYY